MPRTTSSRSRSCSATPRSSATHSSRSADMPSATPAAPRWRRVVFKPSGEALAGPSGTGIDGPTIDHTARQIIEVRQQFDVDVAVVVGGGNFWRGRQGSLEGMDATQSDHIGMLGTVMN